MAFSWNPPSVLSEQGGRTVGVPPQAPMVKPCSLSALERPEPWHSLESAVSAPPGAPGGASGLSSALTEGAGAVKTPGLVPPTGDSRTPDAPSVSASLAPPDRSGGALT